MLCKDDGVVIDPTAVKTLMPKEELWFIKCGLISFRNRELKFTLRDVSLFFQRGRSEDYYSDEDRKRAYERIMVILQKRYKMYLPYKGK